MNCARQTYWGTNYVIKNRKKKPFSSQNSLAIDYEPFLFSYLFCLTTCLICCRDLDLFCESRENDFDAILAEMEKERNVDNIMMELGYGCTVNALQCKEILCLFLPLTEATISRLLGTVARTQAGLGDTQNTFVESLSALGSNSLSELPLLSSWNIEILIDSVKQLVSSILQSSCCNFARKSELFVPKYLF